MKACSAQLKSLLIHTHHFLYQFQMNISVDRNTLFFNKAFILKYLQESVVENLLPSESHAAPSVKIWYFQSSLVFGSISNWLLSFYISPDLLKGQSLTLTASRMRTALARSFSLLQALSAESRIFGSGTRSYPIRVFMPSE